MSIFTSPAAGFMLYLRDPQFYIDPGSGIREQTRPALVADFYDASTTGSAFDEDNNMRHAVRGGAFDTEEAAQRLNWSPEEQEFAEHHLNRLANDPTYRYVQRFEPPVPQAPWPTYDNAHHFKVAALAADLGLVAEALAYERTTKNRDAVVKALEEKLEVQETEDALTAV